MLGRYFSKPISSYYISIGAWRREHIQCPVSNMGIMRHEYY